MASHAETVNVMKDNMVRVQERGENLNDLQGKTGECIEKQIDYEKQQPDTHHSPICR